MNPITPNTVYIIEDEGVLRNLFAEYFAVAMPDMQIVGSSGNGQDAVTHCLELKPNIAIVDIRLPEVNGLEILHILKKRSPDTQIIIFSGTVSPETIKIALKGKADAFVEKADGLDQIKKAIETVRSGNRYYSPKVYKHILNMQTDALGASAL